MCFSDPGDGAKKAAATQERERALIRDALGAYNARASPFFAFENNRNAFSESFFPQFGDSIRNPTLSPNFKLLADEGLRTIRENAAVTGSPNAGRTQIAEGRYLAGLGGHAYDVNNNNMLAAVNMRGQLPVTQEPAYLNQTAGLTESIAEAQSADAQEGSGWGGLFGNLAGTLVGKNLGITFPKIT